MYITLPQRSDAPKTQIYAKILKKDNNQDVGSETVIVLIHGGPGGNHSLYADIANDLKKLATLVLIDLRGCGLSEKIDARYCTMDNHIDDIPYILKELKLSKPIIHGCSYGALVTLGFSIKYPELLSKQILSSCVVSGQFIKIAKNKLQQIGTTRQIQAAEKLWSGKFKTQEQFLEYYNILAPLYFYNQNTAIKNSPDFVKKIPYNIELVNLGFKTFLNTFDFTEQLSTVKTHTLIFAGTSDWIFDITQAEILRKKLKQATLIRLDNCGHFPWKDQKEIFLHSIMSFINN